jgi:hypothetical protein
MMNHLSFVLLSLALAAACGGKSTGPSGATAGAPAAANAADDPATPFDDAAVKAALASTPGSPACGVEPPTTMGAHLAAQRTALETGGDTPTEVDEDFRCNAMDEGLWECQWSVFTKPSGTPDPDDPCGGEGGSGYIIIVNVGDDGAIRPADIYCNAPG